MLRTAGHYFFFFSLLPIAFLVQAVEEGGAEGDGEGGARAGGARWSTSLIMALIVLSRVFLCAVDMANNQVLVLEASSYYCVRPEAASV